jgi:hypothetical protein
MEEAAVVREEKGPVSVLTMQYRPYNLLGPTLLGAIADEIGEVRSLDQLSEMEWAEYWGTVQEVSDRGGTYRLPGRPWRFSGERLAPLGEPAFQGEHNRPVFAELGLRDEEIDVHVSSGALFSALLPARLPRNFRYPHPT